MIILTALMDYAMGSDLTMLLKGVVKMKYFHAPMLSFHKLMANVKIPLDVVEKLLQIVKT